jgi:hypothetical protein
MKLHELLSLEEAKKRRKRKKTSKPATSHQFLRWGFGGTYQNPVEPAPAPAEGGDGGGGE